MYTETMVTLGPATSDLAALRTLKALGVDFVRVNMSHSSLSDLRGFIHLAQAADIPFVLDTEGSQVRMGLVDRVGPGVFLSEGAKVELTYDYHTAGANEIPLRPSSAIHDLGAGDVLELDFNGASVRVEEGAHPCSGYVLATVVTAGVIQNNKAVTVHQVFGQTYRPPTISAKDLLAIGIGLEMGVEFIALSFVRSAGSILDIREATEGKMLVISKVECTDALTNLDEIIEASDYLLIDRGDLSREVPIQTVPFLQKSIIDRAVRGHGKRTFVATNLLESMIANPHPTVAEVSDIANAVVDGATGLVLAGETAIGQYPFLAVRQLNAAIEYAERWQVNGQNNLLS